MNSFLYLCTDVMILSHISIVNYRNIAQAELDFSPGINCLIGNNGEGKTNLLDAIYFLSLSKSSFTSQDSLCILHDAGMMSLGGDYVDEDGTTESIRVGLKRGQKKIMRRGAKTYKRISDHIGLIPLVLISPEDNTLVSGDSAERRRFMDSVIAQTSPPYLEALTSYAKALQQRNALLKAENEPDPTLLSLWEEEMARHGALIYEQRKAFIQQFTPVFQATYDAISQHHEEVSLTYESHGERGNLLETIRNGRDKDRIVGYSLHGTHRDDLSMTVDGYPLRREASLGQKRTMVLSMKMAQFDFLRHSGSGTTPILLLDDIFDRLDARRVEQIVELVSSQRFGQTFITDTNRDHLDSILESTSRSHRIFSVQGGHIA